MNNLLTINGSTGVIIGLSIILGAIAVDIILKTLHKNRPSNPPEEITRPTETTVTNNADSEEVTVKPKRKYTKRVKKD